MTSFDRRISVDRSQFFLFCAVMPMKTSIVLLACIALLCAVSLRAADPPVAPNKVPHLESKYDAATLDKVENTPPEGFVAMFNGKDLTGWKGLLMPDSPAKRRDLTAEQLAKAQEVADKNMKEHWSVENGVIVFDGHGRNLCSAKD